MVNKNYIIYLILFILSISFGYGQVKNEQLKTWSEKFYTPFLHATSKNMEWVVLIKKYESNNDSLVLVNTLNSTSTPIIGWKETYFVGNKLLLLRKKDEAKIIDLKKNKTQPYLDVSAVGVLSDSELYYIHYKNNIVAIYNTDQKLKTSLTNVERLITNKKDVLFLLLKNNNVYELFDLQKNKVIYATKNKIKNIDFNYNDTALFITEEDVIAAHQLVHRLDFKDNVSISLLIDEVANAKQIMLLETPCTGQLVIALKTIVEKYNPHKMVELWYGNDKNLSQLQQGIVNYEFYSIKEGTNELKKIMKKSDDLFILPLNANYLLGIKNTKDYNYETFSPKIELELINTENLQSNYLGKKFNIMYKSPEVIISPNGRYILTINENKRWQLIDTLNGEHRIIPVDNLLVPVFSDDNQTILFESKTDVLQYDLKSNMYKFLNISSVDQVTIVNKNTNKFKIQFNVFTSYYEKTKPVIFLVKNEITKENEVKMLKNNKIIDLVGRTDQLIKLLDYSQNIDQLIYSTENYNQPPVFHLLTLANKQKKEIYTSNAHDKKSKEIKQEIINYSYKEHDNLKGILFYPEDFDATKVYPMIVHVYQKQMKLKNRYLKMRYLTNVDGFDIRTLLKKGYLVYLPDIVFSDDGTGLSALACVNLSLDALRDKQFINFSKVGLIGHSHGGYETNFIATHSNRFATYVSGSGNSDIIRSYFSYNYNFSSPFYWQYEDEQYEMKDSFLANKEKYFKNNPIYNVDAVNQPILLWAGKKDENIAWDQVMQFYIGLKRNNKDVIALFYNHKGHDLGNLTQETEDITNRILQWWDYFLKDKKEVDWINQQMNKAS